MILELRSFDATSLTSRAGNCRPILRWLRPLFPRPLGRSHPRRRRGHQGVRRCPNRNQRWLGGVPPLLSWPLPGLGLSRPGKRAGCGRDVSGIFPARMYPLACSRPKCPRTPQRRKELGKTAIITRQAPVMKLALQRILQKISEKCTRLCRINYSEFSSSKFHIALLSIFALSVTDASGAH